MPKENDALYSRGKYRLEWDERRDGTLRTPYLQIVWYDESAGRNRSKSTGTASLAEAEDELDKLYLKRERGQAICSACGQPIRFGGSHLVTTAIADYLVARADKPSIGSIRPRLSHITNYLADTDQLAITCDAVDDDWIEDFREWALEIPVISPSKNVRDRQPGTVEASVRQLAAAINYAFARKDTTHPAGFKVRKPQDVSKTPTHRSDVKELASMFRYAMKPGKDGQPMNARQPLLKFLQASVITWGRPDAVYDISTQLDRRQWHSSIRVLDLNPKGRAQTRKYRPAVPVGERGASLFDNCDGYFVDVDSVTSAWATMAKDLGLPREGEAGTKLIRRSMATLARRLVGEEHYIQVERMLGHRKSSTSDLYALFDPGMLGRVLEATNAIIEDIEQLAPGAFHRKGTGLRLLKGGAVA